ncbi:MAG: HlyC/CorC family transporter [Lachnospiraceae bacterium]|nr:HlyC/CorC family transporter [Lachnospiraceae bacterium]
MDDEVAYIGIILIFLFLLILDMIFYGFNAALQSQKNKEPEDNDKEPDKKMKRLQYIIDNPAKYTSALPLGIATVNMLIGAVFLLPLYYTLFNSVYELTTNSIGVLQDWQVVCIYIFTAVILIGCLLYIVLTFGVLIPRRIASVYPDVLIRLCITPVYCYVRVASPFTTIASATARGILKLFGIKGLSNIADVTEEGILSMINAGHEQGVLLESEAEMLTNIFEYHEKEAKDIMVNRNNMIAIDSNTTLLDAASFILNEHNSRFPVYEETIDHIVGILHLKDVMRMQMNEKMLSKPIGKIKGLLREPLFITETRNIDDLLKTMQTEKIQMAIVIDEYGQTAGLLALEDILEEIVGNIQDEYDEEESYIKKNGQDEYIIDGMMPLDELEEQLEIDLGEKNFDTVNGFVISHLEHIPEENEEFEFECEGYIFKILQAKDRMIQSIMAVKKPDENNENNEEDENNIQAVEETKEK